MEFGIRFIPCNPNPFPNPTHRNPQNRIPSWEVQANHTLIILIIIQFLALHLLLVESFSENKFSCHFFFCFCTFSLFYNFDILDLAIICIILSRQWTTKVLIRLCGCAGCCMHTFVVRIWHRTNFLMKWLVVFVEWFDTRTPIINKSFIKKFATVNKSTKIKCIAAIHQNKITSMLCRL